MTHEKGKFRLVIERMKFEEFKVLWVVFALASAVYIGAVMNQIESDAKIEPREGYLSFPSWKKGP